MNTLKKENLVAEGINAAIVTEEKSDGCKINVGFAPEKDGSKIAMQLTSENGQQLMLFVNLSDAAQLENALFHARRMAQGTQNERPPTY